MLQSIRIFMTLLSLQIVFAYNFKEIPSNQSMATIQLNEDFTDHITEIISPQGVKGGLFLGNQKAASNLELIKKHKINCIITIAAQLDNKYPTGVSHKKISINDEPLANIYEHFEPNYAYIKKGLSQGNVLIHCRMGMSRSAALVIAFIMRKYKCGYEKAYKRVKDRRQIVNPNSGFVHQLKLYDKKIKELVSKTQK